ncbi:DUF2610 domain-containing protein [candidate division KSB1 bacterium]|nr:DUF2610 domain-containing protein [candidate division KSB1 bacterium]
MAQIQIIIPVTLGDSSAKESKKFYIGSFTRQGYFPLHFQLIRLGQAKKWLPIDIISSFIQLEAVARQTGIDFPDLVKYALTSESGDANSNTDTTISSKTAPPAVSIPETNWNDNQHITASNNILLWCVDLLPNEINDYDEHLLLLTWSFFAAETELMKTATSTEKCPESFLLEYIKSNLTQTQLATRIAAYLDTNGALLPYKIFHSLASMTAIYTEDKFANWGKALDEHIEAWNTRSDKNHRPALSKAHKSILETQLQKLIDQEEGPKESEISQNSLDEIRNIKQLIEKDIFIS